VCPARVRAAGVATDDCSVPDMFGASVVLCEHSVMKRGFTLIEILIVISIIALLMAILTPALSRAREQARIVVANAELYGIGIALEAYSMNNNNKYPPTRADCPNDVRAHIYALPEELIHRGYLPKGGEIGKISYAKIEDEFNPGYTYKYIAVGPKYDFSGGLLVNQHLYIPKGYPYSEDGELAKYNDPENAPLTWVLFSVGPEYDEQILEEGNFPLTSGFPVLRDFWYSSQTRKGILTRIRLKRGRHVGTFLN